MRRGLGDAEVDDLRDRLVPLQHHQDVRRLQVAMEDRLHVRVLHPLADLLEQPQAL